MSLPPDNDNPDTIQGLVNELSKELESAGFVDDNVQEELMHGIQDSLRAIFGEVFEPEPPAVTVVEGGRTDDEPAPDRPQPQLRVASFEDVEEPIESLDSSMSFDSSNVSVRVIRPKGGGVPALSSGNIHLDEEGASQCIYAGQTAKMYRLLLFRGEADVYAGDTCIGIINEKQSMDVEGVNIKVCARTQEVTGIYSYISVTP